MPTTRRLPYAGCVVSVPADQPLADEVLTVVMDPAGIRSMFLHSERRRRAAHHVEIATRPDLGSSGGPVGEH
jgi:hypothetical protein